MRYKVIAKKHKVFGKGFGDFFERNLPDAQERTLIGGGFIVRAPVIIKRELPPRPPEVAFVLEEKEPDEATDAPSTEPPEGMSSSA